MRGNWSAKSDESLVDALGVFGRCTNQDINVVRASGMTVKSEGPASDQ